MKLKLTKTAIDALRYDPAKGQVSCWDTETKGFVLNVNEHSRTFSASGYVHGKPVWTKIGRFGIHAVEQARLRAKELLIDMDDRTNPWEVKRAAAAKKAQDARLEQEAKTHAVTLRQALETLLAERWRR